MQSLNLVFLYVSAGIGSCLGIILLLYNVVAAILYLREETEGTSSGLAKAAWALGLVALFTWAVPCVGILFGVAAIVVGRVERGRIYRDEASLAGATPVRMGNVNGWVALGIQLMTILGLVAGVVMGTGSAPIAP